jgi:hypothetical protein
MDETVGQRAYSTPPQPFLGTPVSGVVEATETTEREIVSWASSRRPLHRSRRAVRRGMAVARSKAFVMMSRTATSLTHDQFSVIRPVTKQPETVG